MKLRTALVFVALTQPAMADSWGVVETPAAFAVSDAQSSVFRPGVMPALGYYFANDHAALGVRARAGILRDGPAPGMNFADPQTGGLVSGGVAFRLGTRGGWLEAVVGAGLTGHDTVPVFEGGAGWDFSVGNIDVGPSARLVHVVAESSDRLGSADIVLVGIGMRFGASHPHPVHVVQAPLPPPPPEQPPPPPELDRDHVADTLPSCVGSQVGPTSPAAPEDDGCPLVDDIVVVDDRIVLDDRVFFDFDKAHVHTSGRVMIGKLAKLWAEHPEWDHLTVEGHADTRGTDAYNQDLSQRRADRVRAVFVGLGIEPQRIDAIGYGRSRPRDPGDTEQAHQHNRRVEFVVHRKGE